ncbi:LppP/LprE family lipoprotein [Prescottella equi]|uniref:LppP/LprE family lipoprotein n=1 Tax=Rhodococcus hoagii TaxID=43767 RepID=UPI00384C8B8B
MTFELGGLPLKNLIDRTDGTLDDLVSGWLASQGEDPPSDNEIARDRLREVIVDPAAVGRLRRFHVARFALATAASMDYHAGTALEAAHRYGASYQELGNSIGATRQYVQRKYGVTAAERDAVTKAIADAVATLEPFPSLPDAKWSTNPLAHNVSTESDLSAALVTLESATVSSPVHVLLFHRGKYIGTATDQATAGVHLLGSASTNSAVTIEFRQLGRPHAGPPTRIDTALFRWRDGQVQWFDTLPEGLTSSVARCGYIRYFETMAHTPGRVLKCDAPKVHESHLNGSTVLRVQKPDQSIEYVAGTRYDKDPLKWRDLGSSVVIEISGKTLPPYPAGTDIRLATREDLRKETGLRQ